MIKTIEQWREYLAATRPGISPEDLERVAVACLGVEQAIAAGRVPKRPEPPAPEANAA